ncbi:MAG: phosphatase PAP2 family protein [Lachnospiraceae bacterium]|nr:phosphatase PAP2 family protein [Lachnospiraceae bacterium]
MDDKYHYNISSPIDDLVPFMPQFIIVYFGCFIFWAVNYCMIARLDKEHVYRFFTADFYARLACLIIFVLFPTTNTRPELVGNDFFTWCMRFLYQVDAPTNLFPSIHCMTSWFCYIGIRNKKGIPLWYQRFSGIMAIAVFISTLALRQHVLIDVIAGVVLAQLTYYISQRTEGYKRYREICENLGDRIMARIEGRYHDKQETNVI